MPRSLNVEKLEKKFASLTRSRESIQGLSSWIMHHQEYCHEIVEGWFNALMKDFNALSMFFVANDIILHCGKKKVPEFREAFSTVLKKAMSLAKVKEIKVDINRLLTIWHEKEIYDDDFFKNLHDILNNATSEDHKESDIEEASSESEIIAKYKLQKLNDSVQNLKKMCEEVNGKERKFKNMKEPEPLNLDALIVRMDRNDSQKQLQKADAYCKYLESLIASVNMLNKTRNNVLKHLRYASVFYAVQNDEVKKVAQAYRIYGKKLKIMEKSLSTKISELRESFPSPIQESPVYDPTIDTYSSPNSPTDNSKHMMTVFSDSQTSLSPSNSAADKMESTSQDNEECVSESENLEKSCTNPSLIDEKTVTGDKEKDTEPNSDLPLPEVQDLDAKNQVTLIESESKTEKEASSSNIGYLSEVDFLLEKAFDDRQIKQRANIKRKIESLLKSKSAKTRKLSTGEFQTLNLSEIPIEVVPSNVTEEKCDDSKNQNTESVEIVSSHTECKETLNETNYEDTKETPSQKTDNEQLNEEINSSEENSPVNNVNLDTEPQIKLNTMCTFTDIPMELLKNILDKNKINMSQTPQSTELLDKKEETQILGKVCLESETISKHAEESEKSLSDSIHSSEKEENISDVKDVNKNHNSPNKENEKIRTNAGDSVVTKSMFCESEKSPKLITIAPSSSDAPIFLDVLQETLQCITKQFTSPKSSDNITEKSNLDIPFANYLKMYKFLLKCDKKSSGKITTNESNVHQSERTLPNSVQPVLNTSVNISTNEEKKYKNNHEGYGSSKFDNLEVMDMEVDSEDEIIKM